MRIRIQSFQWATFLFLSTVLLCLLAACTTPPDTDANTPPPPSLPASSAPTPEPTPDRRTHAAQGVVFEVPADWTQAEGSDLFYTEDSRQVYGLNGASPLGSYTPQAFFEELTVYYQTGGEFDRLDLPEALSPWQSKDGTACYTTDLTGYHGSILYCTKIIIAPQKNLVLTFCAQANADDVEDPAPVWETLNTLCSSLTFEVGSQDYISGNTFLCGDGSQLCLEEDGSFRYYQSADDHENQYYEGIYEVYYGQAALEQIASMTEYGLTMEELEQVLSMNRNGYIPGGSSPADYLYGTGELEDNRTRYSVCLDTFYAVILNNQRLVQTPDQVTEGGNRVLYLGYYLPDLELADMTNANAASHTQWQLQRETDNP